MNPVTPLTPPRGGLVLTWIAVAVAAVIWYFLFAVPGVNFWALIAPATLTLGVIGASIVYPDTYRASGKLWLNYVIVGLVGSAVLYAIFWIGNELVAVLPFMGEQQVENVYSTKAQAAPNLIGTLLLFPIGPGEELFWRAWVQRALMNKYGPQKGFLIATFFYTAIHIPSMNLTLIAAALVAGIFWGLMYMRIGHIGPGLVSHALWDAAVFVWFPFQ
ncbi:CPBP family intramembrane metalloprotease [bacterium]|nr:CPBP family intramembrane metalloprotease [bacterium]